MAELQHLAELSSEACRKLEKEKLDKQNEGKQKMEKEIKDLKSELANTIASNVELDETNRELNVKLTAIQELYKNATGEIANLKSQNDRLQNDLEHKDALIKDLIENQKLIQAQVNQIIPYQSVPMHNNDINKKTLSIDLV